MLSVIYYIFLTVLCLSMMLLSLVALIVCYPFDRGRRVVHELSRVMTRIFFGIPPFWRFRVEGREYVDRKKRYVIVLNHQAMTDIPALYFLPLNFRWVSKREVFRIPFFGQFLLLHGDIPIDRGRAAAALEQMITAGRYWTQRGASIAIFPEGTRSKDGEIHRFKAGAFTLAKECDVEILPVVLDGTKTLIGKNRLFRWHNTMTIRVLKPVSQDEVRNTEIHELMNKTQQRMSEELASIRNQKATK